MDEKEFFEILIKEIEKAEDVGEILKIRDRLLKEHQPKVMPSLTQILIALKGRKLKALKIKPRRSASGVSVVAVMSKPGICVKGKEPCIMCPGGPDSVFGNVPQSYTGREPATMRALRNNFHPYLQVMNRLLQYMLIGQVPSKIELIVMGGNFTSYSKKYQNWFLNGCFKAMNDFGRFVDNWGKLLKFFELDIKNEMTKEREKKIMKKELEMFKKNKDSFEKSKLKNEKGKVRVVALCLETRPDYCDKKRIKLMLDQGCTRVELGVQSLNDKVLDKINRGHSVKDSIDATKSLKENFLKVGYHVMIGLPGSKNDVRMFEDLFEKKEFRPDALKIYPCMVLRGTKLYDLWKARKYKPLTNEKAIKIISKGKMFIPEFCRVMRVQRDIPWQNIETGVNVSNLRQYIKEECRCIRCREPRGRKVKWDKLRLIRRDYDASDGKEVFLSFEEGNILVGFLRLRLNENGKCGVRELHVYGETVQIGEKGKVQHRGLGKKLLKEAEDICKKEFNVNRLYVISGIGVREYYKKLGYKKEGTYMVKRL